MPEYSTPKITPASGVKVPGNNGSSGYLLLEELLAYYLSSKGQANGIASLGADGKLSESEIPEGLDDVLVYPSYASLPATGVQGKLYVDKATPAFYIWNGSAYVEMTQVVQTLVQTDTRHSPSSAVVHAGLASKASQTDLDAEETARQNAINAEATTRANMDSQLDKRVSNLEQKDGDYSETRYQNAPSGVVPTGKAKYAGLSVLRGVTRAWNQLVDDNTSTVTLTNGHKYLTYISGSYAIATGDGSSISVTGGTDCVYDLTLLGASDTSSVSAVLAQFPQLGQYNSHDAGSLVSNTISGLTSQGANLIDGTFSRVTHLGDANNDWIRFNTKIRGVNGKTLYLRASAYERSIYNVFFCFYDSDDNFIGRIATANYVTPSYGVAINVVYPNNTDYCMVVFYDYNGLSSYTPTNAMLNVGSTPLTYTPYWSPVTLSLPSPVTPRSAGSVQDTLELNVEVNGVAKRRDTQNVGSIAMDSDSLGWGYSNGFFRSSALASLMALPSDGATKGNMICKQYETKTYDDIASSDPMAIAISSSGLLLVSNTSYTDVSSFKNAMSGYTLYYALATPVVTLSDPLTDNLIYTESGGTLTPVQTQTPTIDTDFTMEYIAIGA